MRPRGEHDGDLDEVLLFRLEHECQSGVFVAPGAHDGNHNIGSHRLNDAKGFGDRFCIRHGRTG